METKMISLKRMPKSALQIKGLKCFTPLVTLATFIIELALAIIALIKYRKTIFGQLTIAILIFLALFQLSEYMICTGAHIESWTLIGYICITTLPPLGLHIVSIITKRTFLTFLAYILGALIISVMIIKSGAIFSSPICTGNYLIFQTGSIYSKLYGIYYLGFLLIAVAQLIYFIIKQQKKRALLGWMLAGYLSFLLPTYIINIFIITTRKAVPSIMCGFAVILALIIIGRILPLYSKKKIIKSKYGK